MSWIEISVVILGLLFLALLCGIAAVLFACKVYDREQARTWERRRQYIIGLCANIERYCTPEFPDVVICARHIRRVTQGETDTGADGLRSELHDFHRMKKDA